MSLYCYATRKATTELRQKIKAGETRFFKVPQPERKYAPGVLKEEGPDNIDTVPDAVQIDALELHPDARDDCPVRVSKGFHVYFDPPKEKSVVVYCQADDLIAAAPEDISWRYPMLPRTAVFRQIEIKQEDWDAFTAKE